MKAQSGAEGLEVAQALAARNTPIALFLVDQRMPGMSGTDMLREAMKLHPDARRVLLTAYADTDVAISGINDIALDYYLMKPWDPPEQRLYPVLDDLLGEWQARTQPVFEGIRVLGSQWSPQSHATKEFLSRNRVPYEWVDVDQDEPARTLARVARRRSHAAADRRLPRRLAPRRADDGGARREGGTADAREESVLRRRRRGRRTGGSGERGLRRVGGTAHGARRVGGGGRTGGDELDDRELPRLPDGRDGRRSRAARHDAGEEVRRRAAHRTGGRRAATRGSVSHRRARRRHRAHRRTPSSSRPA